METVMFLDYSTTFVFSFLYSLFSSPFLPPLLITLPPLNLVSRGTLLTSSMASDSDSAASFLEQLINSRNRDLSFSLPMILGFSSSSRRDSAAEGDAGSEGQTRDRIVLINPLTQGMLVIETSRSLEDLIRDFANKEGPKPASKASIDAMPKVVITAEEEEGEDRECSICLDGWEIGEEAREMPCKHRYHSGCIEKWLGVHGSCPLCRYKMPVDEEEDEKKASDGTSERGDVWVTFAFNGARDSSSSEDDGAAVVANEEEEEN